MKKFSIIFTAIITTIIMMCGGMNAFAGDVPECLMEDKAQIYFGKIVDFGEKTGETYNYIEVMSETVIKGNIAQSEIVRYKDVRYSNYFMGKGNKDEIYLFAYYDENNPLYCFKVTEYDTKTLKLVGIGDDDVMWKRFESYLNEGKYGEVKIEGVNKSDNYVKNTKILWILIPFAIFTVVILLVMKIRRKTV